MQNNLLNMPGTINVFSKLDDIESISGLNIAVMVHISCENMIEKIFSSLQNIPYQFDLLISCVDNIAEKIEEKQKLFSLSINKIIIRTVEARGADILPWLTAFSDIHLKYDIVLKFQLKKHHWLDDEINSRWNALLLEAMAASPGYVSKILKLFDEEKKLGMVFHPVPPLFHRADPCGHQGACGDRQLREEWFQRLGIRPPEEHSAPACPAGIFWYRPQALHALLNYPLEPHEFPPDPFSSTGTLVQGLEQAIPYIAQAHGYYYKLVIPEDLLIEILYKYNVLFEHMNEKKEPMETMADKAVCDPCKDWSPAKRRFAPLLACLPSVFFPTTVAGALYLSGKKEKAVKLLQKRKKRSVRIDHLMYRIENDIYNTKIDIQQPVAEEALPSDTSQTAIHAIAYYLPQFHAFPENDAWWGKGFTEWTNVTRAYPMFKGHIQPKVPGLLGYYNLSDISIMQRQADMARQFGIKGFCFYYYYFNGKRLMEKPLDNLINHPEVDMPFCLCWANENWTRKWDGKDHDVLIKQEYSPDDDVCFIKSVIPYFNDKRYIRIYGKPILLIYNVKQIPDIRATVERWRKTLKKEGLDAYLVMVHFHGPHDPRQYGFDAAAEFRPHELTCPSLPRDLIPNLNACFDGRIQDYSRIPELNPPRPEKYTLFRGVCVNFDNTPRCGFKGGLYVNNSPRTYETWLDKICDFTYRNMPPDERYIFINAWNEWAEGAVLEPDKAWGFGYLNATSRVLSKYKIVSPT